MLHAPIRLVPALLGPGLLLGLLGALGCSASDAPSASANAEAERDGVGAVSATEEPVSPELAAVSPRSKQADSSDGPAPLDGPTAASRPDPNPETMTEANEPDSPSQEIATLGAGCFWCIEAVLEQVEGVQSVESGYTGGQTDDPTYQDICTGRTGHAEVVRVAFDPSVISYAELLDWFWRLHDPTTLNRQGNDRGTQYRSAIFYHSDAQRLIATTAKADVQPTFSDPIVTEVTAASTFYPAEEKHQGYYVDNSSQGYCRMVIAPKLKKLGLKY